MSPPGARPAPIAKGGADVDKPTVEERFWSKVTKTETCWLWTRAKTSAGYGQFRLDGQAQYAHRLAYQWLIGPIPEGLQIDHLCRVPACVNPAHLEPVTSGENSRRGVVREVLKALRQAKTHCPQGHAYDEKNTRWCPNGGRACRACARERAWRKRESHRSETHCRRGHLYTAENTHIRPDGRRRCRTCARDWMRQKRAEQA